MLGNLRFWSQLKRFGFGKARELEIELAAEVKPIELQKCYIFFWNADIRASFKNCPKNSVLRFWAVFGSFWWADPKVMVTFEIG